VTFLLACSLRAAAIVAIGLVISSLLRRASAASRHALLAAAMVCSAVLPILMVASPQWKLEMPAGIREVYGLEKIIPSNAPHTVNQIARVNPPDTGIAPPVSLTMPTTPLATATDSPRTASIPRPYLTWIWGAGAVMTLAFLLIGWTRLVWIAWRSDPMKRGKWTQHASRVANDYGLQRRRIRLLQSRHHAILATWGYLRPKVALPRDADQWDEDRIHVVLRHELAHIRRHDWLIQMLSELLRVVYWFNPLIWLACSRLRRESEQACDDTVLNSGIASSDYAAHLLDLARMFHGPRHSWSPALLMARGSLEQRFKALLNPDLNRRALTRLALTATGILFVGITLPIAALRVSAQEMLSLELPIKVLSAPLSLISPAVTPSPAESAFVSGVAVRMDTGEPLAEVHVALSQVDPRGEPRVVMTGRDGKFAFTDVMPGEYRLVAARESGYLPAEFGQRSPSRVGLAIKLEAGQKLTDVLLSLAQPGSISGRVLDSDGEPIGRAQVQALRTVYIDGQRSESIVASVATDDRGDFRLYWLPPGQYHVSATPQDARKGWVPVIARSLESSSSFYTLLTPPSITRRVLDSGEVQEEIQVPTYFPETAALETAAPVDVQAGANITGVNIRAVPPVQARHIRGILIDAVTAQPLAGGSVRAVPLLGGLTMGTSGLSDRNGRFEIPALIPGSYLLTANSEANVKSGTVQATIASNDLENVSIELSAGVDIPVRVQIEGRPAGSGITMRFRQVPGQSFLGGLMPMRPGTPQWNLLTTSKFTMEGVRQGDYRLSFVTMGDPRANAALPVYVKSLRLGNDDVLNDLMHVTKGSDHQQLDIVLSANVATLDGRVLNSKQEPVANVNVALVPDAPYRTRSDLYKTVPTDTSGRFHMTGIAPGNYRVFAWDDVDGFAWRDPEWLRPFEGRGKPLHFEEAGRENIQLSVIR
jgi:beta-lactamase regulating signal transducer with metallopeptidase domain/protocatechuate 3,4-dioxygenase beta subunit